LRKPIPSPGPFCSRRDVQTPCSPFLRKKARWSPFLRKQESRRFPLPPGEGGWRGVVGSRGNHREATSLYWIPVCTGMAACVAGQAMPSCRVLVCVAATPYDSVAQVCYLRLRVCRLLARHSFERRHVGRHSCGRRLLPRHSCGSRRSASGGSEIRLRRKGIQKISASAWGGWVARRCRLPSKSPRSRVVILDSCLHRNGGMYSVGAVPIWPAAGPGRRGMAQGTISSKWQPLCGWRLGQDAA